jgi:hypothetical protein
MASQSVPEDDASATEAESQFAEKMKNTVTSGFVLAGLALGTKLGLFDILAESDDPLTSGALASKAKCKERLVYRLQLLILARKANQVIVMCLCVSAGVLCECVRRA